VDDSDRLKELREQAEKALKQGGTDKSFDNNDIEEIIHELEVHHVELQMQVSELQQAYERLDILQQQYASLFNQAPVGFIVTNRDGIIQNANFEASSMLGVENPSLKGSQFTDYVKVDHRDTYHLHCRACLREQHAQVCEVQLRRADGTVFYAKLRSHLRDGNSKTLHTAIHDITALKQTQEALQQSLQYQKEVNQLRNRVLSVIAHEFRTPLTGIMTSVELLSNYEDRLKPERKQKHYQTIKNYVWYLNDVVQEIRTAQEFYDHKHRMKLETFDLIVFASQLIEDIQVIDKSTNEIILQLDNAEDEESVTWDQNLVRRILINLLTNALKYSDDTVTCQIYGFKDTIRFVIKDKGMGISAKNQQHMYEAFYRGDNLDNIPGTGIGLYVVNQAVQAHEGHIACDSAPGQGTTFTVELPRHSTEPA